MILKVCRDIIYKKTKKGALKIKRITEIQEKLKRGILEMLILKLLSEEDMYGYQLKTEIMNRSEERISLTEGVLYPPLYRMIEKGYISERKETVCKRRVRVYYHLEDDGREYLELLCEEYRKSVIGVYKIMEWNDGDTK